MYDRLSYHSRDRSAVAQRISSDRLEIQQSLLRASPEAPCCVSEQAPVSQQLSRLLVQHKNVFDMIGKALNEKSHWTATLNVVLPKELKEEIIFRPTCFGGVGLFRV